MNRRNFVIQSGTIITATFLLGLSHNLWAGSGSTKPEDEIWQKRPNPANFEQAILKAIACGVNAASPHNTQSWKFKILDDNTAEVYADETRLLPHVDPYNRQIHIGLACFSETAQIGITKYGYKATSIFHTENYDALKDAGKKPFFTLSVATSKEVAHPLEPYVLKRQTSRKKYKGKMVSQEEFATYLQEAGELFSHVVLVNENLEPFIKVFSDSFYIEAKKYEANEEVRKLFRFNDKDIAQYRDGISLPQMGYGGMIKGFAEKALKNGDHDTWHSEKAILQSLKGIDKGLNSAKGFVFFNTPTNTLQDWINVGIDFVRLPLALVKYDIYNHSYNQPTQEYAELQEEQQKLHQLLGVNGTGKTQLAMRIGKSKTPYFSYRQTLENRTIQ